MDRRRFGKTLAAIVACATFPVFARTGAAQDVVVRVEGRVAWVSGQKMVIAAPGGVPVPIDLSQVDLGQYRALLSGDRVIVTGRLTPDRGRVIATSIRRLES